MARLYADEQFPRQVVQNLRSLGHDVQTVQKAGNAGLPDEDVLAFATSEHRAVLTINRRDFFQMSPSKSANLIAMNPTKYDIT